jgi:NADP-dependent 3-hydroxy acid dehydrogenase YdfG
MSEKVVVITGASSGIGAALARQLGSKGQSLVLAARREKELKVVANQTGTKALPIVTDVTRRNDVERLRDLALKKLGHVDVWVNNAGRGVNKTVMELSDQDLDEMLDVNLKSVLYGIQAIIPHFQERGKGHLINVSSFLGRVPWATYRSAYNAAKSAVNVLTSNLRMDMKKYSHIHVSLVMPGIVDSPFQDVAGTPLASRAGTKLGPFTIQSPEDVASHIAALIEHPLPELYTHPALPELARRYYQDVGAFEDYMANLFQSRKPQS